MCICVYVCIYIHIYLHKHIAGFQAIRVTMDLLGPGAQRPFFLKYT